MTLHYTFTVKREVMVQRYYSCEDIEPDYKTKEVEVDFDYDVTPTNDDYFEYIAGLVHCTSNWTSKEWSYARKLFDALVREELLNTESLEEDDGFIDYMKEAYEEQAHDACQEEE